MNRDTRDALIHLQRDALERAAESLEELTPEIEHIDDAMAERTKRALLAVKEALSRS